MDRAYFTRTYMILTIRIGEDLVVGIHLKEVPDEWSIYPEVALREKSFGTFLTFADTSDSW